MSTNSLKLMGNFSLLDDNLLLNNVNPFDIRNLIELDSDLISSDKTINGKIYFLSKTYFNEPTKNEFRDIETFADIINNFKINDNIPFESFEVILNSNYTPKIINEDDSITPSVKTLTISTNSFIPNFNFDSTEQDYNDYFIILEIFNSGFNKNYTDISSSQNLWLVPSIYCGVYDSINGPDDTKLIEATFYKYVSTDGSNQITKEKKYYINSNPICNEGLYINRNITDPNLTFEEVGVMDTGKGNFVSSFAFDKYVYSIVDLSGDSTGKTNQQWLETLNTKKIIRCEKLLIEDQNDPDYGKEILSQPVEIFQYVLPYPIYFNNVVQVGNKIYFIGGQKEIYSVNELINNDTLDNIYCLTINDDITSQNYGSVKEFGELELKLPKPLFGSNTFIINSRLYLIGGIKRVSNIVTDNSDLYYIDINEDGTLSSDGWGFSQNGIVGYTNCLIQTKSKIYILGGRNTNPGNEIYSVNYSNLETVLANPNNNNEIQPFTKEVNILPTNIIWAKSIFITENYAFIFGYNNGTSYKNDILYAPIDSNGILGQFTIIPYNLAGLNKSAIIPTKDYLYKLGGYDIIDNNSIVYDSISRVSIPNINLIKNIDNYSYDTREIQVKEKAFDTKNKLDLFDDGSSELLLNFNPSPNDSIGTYYGESKYGFGSSRVFNGSTDYQKLNINLNPNGFTISTNFKIKTAPVASPSHLSQQYLWSTRTNSTSLDGLSLSYHYSKGLTLTTRDTLISGTEITYLENVLLNTLEWYNVIVVHSGSETRIFLNNVLYKAYIWNTLFTNFPSNLTIGREAETNSYYFYGNIDQVRYINKSLSSIEKDILFNESKLPEQRIDEADFQKMRIRSYNELSTQSGYLVTANKVYVYGWRLNNEDFSTEVYVSDILKDGTIGPKKFLFHHNLGFIPGASYTHNGYMYIFGGSYYDTVNETSTNYKQIYRCKIDLNGSIDHKWVLVGNLPIESQNPIIIANKKDKSIIYLRIGVTNTNVYSQMNLVYKFDNEGNITLLNNALFSNSSVTKIVYIEDDINGDFILQFGRRDNFSNPLISDNKLIKIPLINNIPDFDNTKIVGDFTTNLTNSLSETALNYFEDQDNIYIIGGQELNKTTKVIVSNGSNRIIKLNKDSLRSSTELAPYNGEVLPSTLPLFILPASIGSINGSFVMETLFGWYLIGNKIIDTYGSIDFTDTPKIIEIPKKLLSNIPKDHNISTDKFNLKKSSIIELFPNKFNHRLKEENVSKCISFETTTVNSKLSNLTVNGIVISNNYKPILLSEENKLFIDWIKELILLDGLAIYKTHINNINKLDLNSNYYVIIPEIIFNILRTKELIDFNTDILSTYVNLTGSNYTAEIIKQNLQNICKNYLKSYNGLYDSNKPFNENINGNNFDINIKATVNSDYLMILNSNNLISSELKRRSNQKINKNNVKLVESFIGNLSIFEYTTNIDSNIYFISPDGDDSNDGKTTNSAYLTSQHIPTDSIVILLEGIYDQVHIQEQGWVSYNKVFFGCEGKTLTYYGVNKDNVKLIINRTDAVCSSIISGGSNVKINNLSVDYNSIISGGHPNNVALVYYSGGVIFNNVKINISNYDYYSLSYHPGSQNYAYYYNCTFTGGSYLGGIPDSTSVNSGRKINSYVESLSYYNTPYFEPEINKHLDLLDYNDINDYGNQLLPTYTLLPLTTIVSETDKLVFDNLNRLTILKNININY